ncbi:MAG TPA: iron-sulfur cluster repair di-iron protein [Salinimicrobium sp.]|nr:iron-sulfur cluster repair di-iron protein [Salinimicrobium sp.]
MKSLETKTVADLVTENIKTAHVFKKYGIDFCCQGGISIEKAAEKANINVQQLVSELLAVENSTTRATDYNNWNLDFLTDHVIIVHHAYVEEKIPVLKQYAEKVHRVHGDHYPELRQIKELFEGIAGPFAAHCKKEELILFPFIKKMVKAEKEAAVLPKSFFNSVDEPIKMMEVEHEEAGEVFRKIALLSNNYTPPEGACNTYRAFYSQLDEFEQDLHQHVHLENNILFPKALKLEQKLKVKA